MSTFAPILERVCDAARTHTTLDVTARTRLDRAGYERALERESGVPCQFPWPGGAAGTTDTLTRYRLAPGLVRRDEMDPTTREYRAAAVAHGTDWWHHRANGSHVVVGTRSDGHWYAPKPPGTMFGLPRLLYSEPQEVVHRDRPCLAVVGIPWRRASAMLPDAESLTGDERRIVIDVETSLIVRSEHFVDGESWWTFEVEDFNVAPVFAPDLFAPPIDLFQRTALDELAASHPTLEEASRRASFQLLVPRTELLASCPRVLMSDSSSVILTWQVPAPEPTLLFVFEAAGGGPPSDPGSGWTDVDVVDGQAWMWDGAPAQATRMVHVVRDGTAVRLRASLPVEQLVDIARSLQPFT